MLYDDRSGEEIGSGHWSGKYEYRNMHVMQWYQFLAREAGSIRRILRSFVRNALIHNDDYEL